MCASKNQENTSIDAERVESNEWDMEHLKGGVGGGMQKSFKMEIDIKRMLKSFAFSEGDGT